MDVRNQAVYIADDGCERRCRLAAALPALRHFGFTSQRNEAGFGLMDYNARYYNPRIGRFISPDTIVPDPSNSRGFNRYRYVRNNPLKHVDPSGHRECEEAISCERDPNQADPDNDEEYQRAISYDDDLTYAEFSAGRYFYNQYSNNPTAYTLDNYNKNYDSLASFKLAAATVYAEYGLGVHLQNAIMGPDELGMAEAMHSLNELSVGDSVSGIGMSVTAGSATFKLQRLLRSGSPKTIGTISMDEAVEMGAQFVGNNGKMVLTGKGTNFQFMSTSVNASGQKVVNIARFDVNMADSHVRRHGTHLNVQQFVDGKRNFNHHVTINPSTIRPGDFP